MNITYCDTKEFAPTDLEALYLSVGWASGQYPQRLATALRHSGSVFSAWDGDRLVGLVNALDDCEMTAYIHYLLVHPAYQRKGIGKQLLELIKEKYRDYLAIVLISYESETGFYQTCGFRSEEDKRPLFLSNMKL